MSKPSVLILTPFFRPNIGGVETYLNDLCVYLTKQEFKVFVVTYQPLTTRARGLKIEEKNGLVIHRISWFGHNWFHKFEPYPLLEFIYLTPCLFLYTFFFLLRNHKRINVIHAQGLTAAFITKFLAKIFKKRTVMSTCAVYNLQRRPAIAKAFKWILSGFDKILPLANYSRDELIYSGIHTDNLNTYHLWVDQTKYTPCNKKEVKEKINLENKFTVLFVGRLIQQKGVEILLEVAVIDKQIKFVFIGDDGPLIKKIEKLEAESDNIKLIKGIRGDQLIPYYQAADILIVPSQYEEAFGKVIIEALSCGTPVIGTNKGAVPYILDSSVGRVIDPTFQNIKSEIKFFYNHPEELYQLTMNCRSYAEKFFSDKNAEVISRSYFPG